MWWAVNVLKRGPNISDTTKRHARQLILCDINRTIAWSCRRAELRSVLYALTGWFKKGVLKQEFCGLQLTTFFGIKNFQHIKAMKVIFFSKCSKSYVYFKNTIKLRENVHSFEDNCLWTCCGSFVQLWQEYMWWAVNVLKSSPKI